MHVSHATPARAVQRSALLLARARPGPDVDGAQRVPGRRACGAATIRGSRSSRRRRAVARASRRRRRAARARRRSARALMTFLMEFTPRANPSVVGPRDVVERGATRRRGVPRPLRALPPGPARDRPPRVARALRRTGSASS